MQNEPAGGWPGREAIAPQRVVSPAADSVEVKNRVQVGPIIAGILTAITVMIILTVLGLAVGSSALKPRDVG